jgi:hypothetical protein
MKKGHPVAKITKKWYFFGTQKKENYSVLILGVLFFEFFPHNPLPTSIACVFNPFAAA